MAQTRKRGQQRKAAAAQGNLIDYIKMAVVVAVIVVLVIGVKQAHDFFTDPTKTLKGNVFLQGVHVNGTDMGGLTFDEGAALINEQIQTRLHTPIQMHYRDKLWTITPAELDAKLDIRQKLGLAFNFGNVGSADQRRDQAQFVKSEGRIDYDEEPTYDEARLDAFIAQVKSEIDLAPVNAQVTVDLPETLIISDHADGYALNALVLKEQVEDAIAMGATPDIPLVPEVWHPEHTKEIMQQATQLIATCTTNSTSSTDERVKNIKRSLKPFNGLALQPGEEASFNSIVGKRTVDNKFFEAPEFLDGNLVQGIGGGTCQASTTLYVALRRAGVAITERHQHSQRVAYTSPSMDSTVTDNGIIKDLRFLNDSDYPIYIFTSVDYREATVKIYGMPPENEITFWSKLIQTIPAKGYKKQLDKQARYVMSPEDEPVVVAGKEGKDGYKTQGWITEKNRETGEIVSEYSVSDDQYTPVPPTKWVYYEPNKKK